MTSEWVTTLLVNTLVFSILFCFMLLVRRLLKKRLSAVLRYALWAVVAVKLLIPFGFEAQFSPMSWFAPAPLQAAPSSVPAVQTPLTAGRPAADGQTAPASNDALTGWQNASGGPAAQPNPLGQTAAAPLRWTGWALLVWAGGAAATAGWLLLCIFQAGRRVLRGGTAAPRRLATVFEACRRELGIKRGIGISMQSAAGAPAIMGLIKPVLILPVGVKKDDDETLRHIMLHELMHYRNGDLIVIQLMNLINALYWFNPLVWLCVRLVRKDMETICDQRVLRLIGQERRNRYVKTVLQFSGKSSSGRLHAALCINAGRTNMERRIRDMFGLRKTGKSTRIAVAAIALMMLTASALTACQPTPTKAVVVNKGDGKLESRIASTSAPEKKYEAPASWKDSFDANGNAVNVDAQITLPSSVKFPILLIEPANFTKEQVRKAFEALTGGKQVMRAGGLLTKDELTQQLIQLKADWADGKLDMNEEQYRQSVAACEESIRNAPEKRDDGPITPDDYGNELIAGEIDLGNGQKGQITVGNSPSDKKNVRMTYNDGSGGPIPTFDPVNAQDIPVSSDEAVRQANDLLGRMGVGNMSLARIEEGEVITGEEDVGHSQRHCYMLYYTRNDAGVAVAKDFTDMNYGSYKDNPQIGYFVPWPYEQIVVSVDDTGIFDFLWEGNSKVVQAANENVALLDFQKVREIFKEQMKIKYAWNESEQGKYTCNIDRAALGYMRVNKKDAPDNCQLVPVWDFYGTVSTGDPKHPVDYGREFMSFLTINAIDGSVIDRGFGY